MESVKKGGPKCKKGQTFQLAPAAPEDFLKTWESKVSSREIWNDVSPSPEALAKLLGVKEPAWAERLFRQHDNKGNRPLWNSRTRRYCPECLKDKPYWRQAWELSLMTACPVHGRSLIEACPKCDRTHGWQRSTLLTCDCGHEMRRSESLLADEKELRLAQALSHKVLGHDSEIPNLKLLDLGQLHSLIITLGVYAQPGIRPSLRDQRIDSLKSAQQLMRTAAEVLLNWPQGFYRMLDQVQHSMEAEGSASLPGRFGRFYAYLYDHYKEPKYGFLLHAFEKYLEQNWRHPLAERNIHAFSISNTAVLLFLGAAAIFDVTSRISWLMKKAWAKVIGKAALAGLGAAIIFIATAFAKQNVGELTQADPEYFPEFIGLLTSLYTPSLFGVALACVVGLLAAFELLSAILIVIFVAIPLYFLISSMLSKEHAARFFDRIRFGKSRKIDSENNSAEWRVIIYVMRPIALAIAIYMIASPIAAIFSNFSKDIEQAEKRVLVMMHYHPNTECTNLDKKALVANLKDDGIVSIALTGSDINFSQQKCVR